MANLNVLNQEVKKMIKLTHLVVSLGFLLFSCQKEEMKFTYLYHLSTDSSAIEKRSIVRHYAEYVLISSPPNDLYLLDSLLLSYMNKETVSLCDLNDSFSEYFISFHRKTPCTSYFLDNERDSKHQITGDVGCEDDLAMFYYNRSKENPHMWYATYPDNFKDTVYCDSLIIAPPFED